MRAGPFAVRVPVPELGASSLRATPKGRSASPWIRRGQPPASHLRATSPHHISVTPHSATATSSPTDSVPGRVTENFTPNTTLPDEARR